MSGNARKASDGATESAAVRRPAAYPVREQRRQFTLQLATLMGAGIHVVEALDVLERQVHPGFAPVVGAIRARVEQGARLSAAVQQAAVFPDFYVGLLRVAEQTGRLYRVLLSLAEWEDRDERLWRQARSTLTYPLTVLGVAVALTVGLIYAVLPGFFGMFEKMQNLPAPTRILLWISDFLHSPALVLVLGASALGVRELVRFLGSHEGKRMAWGHALSVPALGPCLQATGLARYALAMRMLCDGGMGVLPSCELAAQASGNPLLVEDYAALRAFVEGGGAHSGYLLQRPDLWPRSFAQLVRVGEESARASQIYTHLAAFYEDEVGYRSKLLLQLTEPVLLCILGGAITWILLSIFIPLYGLLHGIG